MTNDCLAHCLEKIAFFLSLQDDNEAKVKAYQKAAQCVRDYPEPIEDLLIDGNDLTTINGIGRIIAKRIEELIVLGEKQCVKRICAPYPEKLFELSAIKALTPRTILSLYRDHQIHSLFQLKDALKNNLPLNLSSACKHALTQFFAK